MAIILCKCTTCKKTTEIVENIYGITTIGSCTITEGCKGKLIRQDRNPAILASSGFVKVSEVTKTDYSHRRTFFQKDFTLKTNAWIVKHELGTLPSVYVYKDIEGGQVQLKKKDFKVELIDANTIRVAFIDAITGTVQCVARSSVPYDPETKTEDVEQRQGSTNGVLTFAIPRYLTQIGPLLTPTPTSEFPIDLCAVRIRIEVEIRKPNQEPEVCLETLTDSIDIRSPWIGWRTLLLEGRRDVCVRTIPILSMKVFGGANKTKYDIPDGTQVKIRRIEYGSAYPEPIPSRGLSILLSKPPYEVIDKDLDNIIDVGELLGDDLGTFIYRNGELFISEDAIESTYPQIQRAELVIPTPMPSVTPSPTITLTPSLTPTRTPTGTPGITVSPTLTPTPSVTFTHTPTPTVTSSHTPTPSPTTSQNAVSLDFDYAVVRFDWDQPNGTDLDIRVDVYQPPRNIIVGAGRNDSDPPYLTWGGDNQTSFGHEAILVDFKELSENYPAEDEFRIMLRAFWYGMKLDGNIRLDYISYKGGEMIRTPDNDFINEGGTIVDSKSIWVNTQMQGGLELPGEELAYLKFDVPTNTGELVIMQPAVTPTVTPTLTPTMTVTRTRTPTPTVTRTMSLTPTATPTRTANITPSVSPTISFTPTVTRTMTVTPTFTPTRTPDVSPSLTPPITPTRTVTRSVTPTISHTPTISLTPTITATLTPTPENTKSATPAVTPTFTPTNTVTPTQTPIVSPTPSVTASITPTFTRTPTVTPTVTHTITPSVTPSITPTITPTVTPSQMPAAMVFAGEDFTSLCANEVTLLGTFVSDEPIQNYSFLWEQLSGPPVIIADPTALITTYTYTQTVDYTFRLWCNKGLPNQTWDDLTVYGTPSEMLDTVFTSHIRRESRNKQFNVKFDIVHLNKCIAPDDPSLSLNFTLPDLGNGRTGIVEVEQYIGGEWVSVFSDNYIANLKRYYVPITNSTAQYRVKASMRAKYKPVAQYEIYYSAVFNSKLYSDSNPHIMVYDDEYTLIEAPAFRADRQNNAITKYNYKLITETASSDVHGPHSGRSSHQNISISKYNPTLIIETGETYIQSVLSSNLTQRKSNITRYNGGTIGN